MQIGALISKVNKNIRRMSNMPKKYQSLEFKELQEMGEGFGRTVKGGVVQYSAKGLNSIQKRTLESVILNDYDYYKVSIYKAKERNWSGDPIKGKKGSNRELSFDSYESEKEFTDRLRSILKKVDFYYDPKNARDFIYDNKDKMSDEQIIEALLYDDHVQIKENVDKGGMSRF